MLGIIQKLFGHHRQENTDERTVPIPELELAEPIAETEKKRVDPPQLIVGCAQSIGMQRDHNEDALFTLTMNLTSDHTSLPFGLYIVADGMGGHRHGEVASGLAVRVMGNYIFRKLYSSLLSLKPTSPSESIQEIMQGAVQEAHHTILRQAPGGGTTLTAVLIFADKMTIAHVGDSRAYAVEQNGALKALTRDHSLVKRLVELGQITTEEAAFHPQRNVLYRALGQGEPFDPDISTSPLPVSGYLLICSDGLWGVVPEEEIKQIIQHTTNPEQACQELVEAANASGGPDNITVILVRMPE